MVSDLEVEGRSVQSEDSKHQQNLNNLKSERETQVYSPEIRLWIHELLFERRRKTKSEESSNKQPSRHLDLDESSDPPSNDNRRYLIQHERYERGIDSHTIA